MSEEHAIAEQGLFLFLGIIVGIMVGVIGNLWADAAFEYATKGDRSVGVTNTLIIMSVILILIILVLSIACYRLYKMGFYFTSNKRQRTAH